MLVVDKAVPGSAVPGPGGRDALDSLLSKVKVFKVHENFRHFVKNVSFLGCKFCLVIIRNVRRLVTSVLGLQGDCSKPTRLNVVSLAI